jgi:hypothetical protein
LETMREVRFAWLQNAMYEDTPLQVLLPPSLHSSSPAAGKGARDLRRAKRAAGAYRRRNGQSAILL